MSVTSRSIVAERIKAASRDSKIAVFKTVNNLTFESVFHSTIKTQELLRSENSKYKNYLIGVYYGRSGVSQFNDDVIRCARNAI